MQKRIKILALLLAVTCLLCACPASQSDPTTATTNHIHTPCCNKGNHEWVLSKSTGSSSAKSKGIATSNKRRKTPVRTDCHKRAATESRAFMAIQTFSPSTTLLLSITDRRISTIISLPASHDDHGRLFLPIRAKS